MRLLCADRNCGTCFAGEVRQLTWNDHISLYGDGPLRVILPEADNSGDSGSIRQQRE